MNTTTTKQAAREAVQDWRLARARAFYVIAERATPEAAQALAAVLPYQRQLSDAAGWTGRYMLSRVEFFTGMAYAKSTTGRRRAAALFPSAAPAAEAIKTNRFRRDLFWGAILRLDQLEGPPPADPEAFYAWCQMEAFKTEARARVAHLLDQLSNHTCEDFRPDLSNLYTGRMTCKKARGLLQLPTSGPLDPAAIRSAYRAQARHHHPDTGGDRRLFEQLSEARERLLLEVA